MAETIIRVGTNVRTGLPAGTRLSDDTYELEKVIAAGGMGEVYRGRLVETGDPVAIKMIKPEFAGDEAILSLFRKEASALYSLSHDAIVRYFIFSVDKRLSRPYLAMEFVDGPSLTDRIKQAPLTFDQLNTLRQRVAAGLQAAHDKGIIHRDISSDNIILPGGNIATAKIIDFGIARTQDLRHATVIGSGFAGKFNYVSPEQLGLYGSEVSNRSDIYSLGLVLAEAARGKPLDMSGSQAEVVEKRKKVPDLTSIDVRLRPLLTRMLQPDPKNRFASMAEVVAWAPPSRKAGSTIAIAAGAALVVLGGGGAAAYFFMSGPTSPTQAERKIEPAAPARPADQAALAPAPAPPSLSATQPSTPTTTATAQPPPAPQAQPAPEPLRLPALTAGDRTARMFQYVRYFDGGPCFYASPTEITDRKAAIDVFGLSDQQVQHFDADFRLVNGIAPQITMARLTAAQCPAVAFLQRLDPDPAKSFRFDLRQTTLRPGQRLQGQIEGVGDRNISILAVGDSGRVKLLPAPRRERGNAVIDARIDDDDNAVPGSKLLIAIASTRPYTLDGKPMAWESLPALLTEVSKRNEQASVIAVPKLVRIER
jgi:serine/threonine-protein kinase